MTPAMRDRVWFFHEHAAWCQDHKMAGAKSLAEAEELAEQLGLEVTWENDQYPDLDFCHERDRRDFEAGRFEILRACVLGDGGEVLVSLNGVWPRFDDRDYRRVVEAVLFQEAIASLKRGAA